MNRLFAAFALLAALPAALLLRPAPAEEPPPPSFADGGEIAPTDAHRKTAPQVARRLERNHFRRLRVDDALSERMLDRYLSFLDPRRSIFLASDVAEFRAHEHALDDAVEEGELQPAFDIFARYLERLREQSAHLAELVEGDLEAIDFEDGEEMLIDRGEAPWPGGRAELEDLWRKRFEGDVLSLLMADQEVDEVRETLERRYSTQLRFTERFNANDVFQLFMNALASSYDPHTQYLGDKSAEDFDIGMSLSVEGIGALLGNSGEYVTVQRIIPGGPAAKDGELEATDRIAWVAQGDEPPVDIVGWRTDEAVELIRGEAGSVVRLGILKEHQAPGSRPKELVLVREAVSIEERQATSQVVEVENRSDLAAPRRFGVIELPDFYMDFEGYRKGDPDYRSTSKDVARELLELADEDVEGVVLDLRGNGGGSLVEVTQLGGLFFGPRPVVQVKGVDPEEAPEVLRPDLEQLYGGPLIVLVDRRSASASEIFAGAVQDYGRALVVGERTFGKGTVQGILPMSSGQLFMTQAKFYRVTGASTQLRGVEPDLRLPDGFDASQFGEDSFDHPLPWDEIEPAVDLLQALDGTERTTRARRDLLAHLPELRESHAERVRTDPELRYEVDLNRYGEDRDHGETLSLDRSERLAEQAEQEERLLAIENAYRESVGEPTFDSLDALREAEEAEEEAEEDAGADPAEGEPDAYQLEAARILADYVDLNRPR